MAKETELQQTKTEPINIINKRLVDIYGRTLDGRPKFRIVWSEDELEKRYGTFTEHYGNIFLREVSCLKEVRKYDYIVPAKYVLEELMYYHNPERPFEFSSYEPKWVFMTKDRKPLWPKWEMVEIVIKSILNGIRKTLSDYEAEDDAKYQKEIQEFEDILNGESGVHDIKNQNSGLIVKPLFLGGLKNG